jgi:hypothetical protein
MAAYATKIISEQVTRSYSLGSSELTIWKLSALRVLGRVRVATPLIDPLGSVDSNPKQISVLPALRQIEEPKGTMKNIKFVVKVNRGGAHAPQYVLRVDRLPIQTTTNRKLALVMGRFTAEDAVKSMQNSHCNPELVSVRVTA